MMRAQALGSAALLGLVSLLTTAATAVPPSQDRIAFVRFTASAGRPRIYVVVPRSGPARLLGVRVAAADGPAWSPDRKSLVFVGGMNQPDEPRVTSGNDLYTARRDGTHVRRLTRGVAIESGPAWSKDGTQIAYVRSVPTTPARSSIYLTNPSGTRVHRLTYGSIDLEPSWSSDGQLIAFLRIDPRTHQSGIWVVRPDGSGRRRILSSLQNVTDPVWSPVAARLLVTDGQRLLVVNADGSGLRTLAKLSADRTGARIDPEPDWSPNGKMVVFAQMRAGDQDRSDIWLVRSDGGRPQRVTVSPGSDFSPSLGG